MTKRQVVTLALWAYVSFAPNAFAQAGSNDGSTSTILVDDDKLQCPKAAFSTIQAAVNAARPGDLIRVCPGTYNEQIAIHKPIVLRADNGVLIRPVGMVSNSAGLTQGDPI